MLEKTHCRIAEEIAHILSLKQLETKLLIAGSAYPDSFIPFPHHHGKDLRIISDIMKAQGLFLQNDDECFHTLGTAFHFIEDRWTLRLRIEEKHTEWEGKIDAAEVLDDDRLRKEISNAALPTKVQNAFLDLVPLTELGISGVSKDAFQNTRALLIENFFNLHPSLQDKGFVSVAPGAISVFSEDEGTKLVGAAWCFGKELSLYYSRDAMQVVTFALQKHPIPNFSTPNLDFNFAFRTCLQIARNILVSKKPWCRIT